MLLLARLRTPRVARFSCLPFDLPFGLARFSFGAAHSLAVLPLALLALPLTQATMAAQQPGYGQPQGYAQPAYPYAGQNGQGYADDGSGQGQAPQQLAAGLSTTQLEQLVAPIALYPDTLVAQVLTAATYPAQVVGADNWRQSMGNAPVDAIVAGADAQPWDPSIKALTAFPQVLAEMDQNLQWATDLGNAYYNQPQDVLEAVQVMRQRAQQAGTLQNNPQEAVSYNQGYIQLAPPNPQVVYVPIYNPWYVYGQPVAPYQGFSQAGYQADGYQNGYQSGSGSGILSSLQSLAGSPLIRYGLGTALSAFSHTNWGAFSWALNWLEHSVLFRNSNYTSQSTTVANWHIPRGPMQGVGQRGPTPQSLVGVNRNQGNYPRPAFGFNRTPEPVISRTQTFADNRFNGYRGQAIPVHSNPERANLERPMPERAMPARPMPVFQSPRPVQQVQQAFNRPVAPPPGRPQPYAGGIQQGFRQDRPTTYGGYGSSYMGRPVQTAPVSRPAYPSPIQSYRAPMQTPQRGYSEARYANPYQGRSYQPESKAEQKNFAKEEKREEKAQRNAEKRMAKEERGHGFGGGHESRGGHGGGGGHFGGGHAMGMFHR
jgi:hypothetical protein